jgi:hypothetical protein
MVKHVASYVGAICLATLAGHDALAAISPGGATPANVSVISIDAPCPPYDAPARTMVHHPRLRPKPGLIPAVNHEAEAKPVAPTVRRRPIHRVAKPAFETPRFLDAAVERPGRCQTLRRGPAGPALISYLPTGVGQPDAGASDVPPGDTAAVNPAAPAVASLPATGGPFVRQSALTPPGGFFGGVPQDQGAGVTPIAPDLPVSDIPEPGVWSLMITGLFGVGYVLRRRRAREGRRVAS